MGGSITFSVAGFSSIPLCHAAVLEKKGNTRLVREE